MQHDVAKKINDTKEQNQRAPIGRRLRTARKRLDWSQEKVAKAIGVTSQAVSNYETGKRDVSRKHLLNLSSLLGVRRAWLEEGRGEMLRSGYKGPLSHKTRQRIEGKLAPVGEALELEANQSTPAPEAAPGAAHPAIVFRAGEKVLFSIYIHAVSGDTLSVDVETREAGGAEGGD